MPLYKVTDNIDDVFASDIDQFTDALNGVNDIGPITLFAPINPPVAPTAAVNPTAGNLNGAYKYAIAFVTGYWKGVVGTGTLLIQGNSGGGAKSSTVSPASQQVNLTNIPVGPTGTVARVIYRTKAGGSTYFAVSQINDNSSTTFTDNIADASISIAMPTTNTTGTKLVSPAMSGIPTVPTAPDGTNTDQAASTAFVLSNGSGKFASYENQVKISSASSNVVIGIPEYIPATDTLQVFQGGGKLTKGIEWKLNANGTSIDRFDGSTWANGTIFDFLVLKSVSQSPTGDIDGTMLIDTSVGMTKLSTALQTSVTGNSKLGTANTDINKVKALELAIDTRSEVVTYTAGKVTKVEKKDGANVVESTVLTYNATTGKLETEAVTAGGTTVTYTYSYDVFGVYTGYTKGVV